MPIDLSITLGGVTLPSCAMNAAGAGSSTADEMRALARSEAGAVVMKSTTVQPVTDKDPDLCGLINPGYRALLPLVGELRDLGKPVIGSVAGFTVEDYAEMSRAYAEAGADIIELNLADPHVVCNTSGGCDLDVVRAVLTQVRHTQIATPLAVKLPPFQERAHLAEVLRLLRQTAVPIVICLNAPLGDSEPSAPLTHVQFACQELQGACDIVAVGGIKNGQETYRAIQQGAAAVQIGSAVQHEGPQLFARLHAELADLLQQDGYSRLRDVRLVV
jgi:dihydroorotate dehydrogenase (fumarate)